MNKPKTGLFDISVGAEGKASRGLPPRGAETVRRLWEKLEPPQFVHSWTLWHDRPDRVNSFVHSSASNASDRSSPDGRGPGEGGIPHADPLKSNQGSSASRIRSRKASERVPDNYKGRLLQVIDISDMKQFWGTLNNFNLSLLQFRDTVHLFHDSVLPLWEDDKNLLGGAWTIRVQKEHAQESWVQIAMMAVGNQLQDALGAQHTGVYDSICGVSCSMRYNAALISIWNQDGDNTEGIKRVKEKVMGTLPEELCPKQDKDVTYSRHRDHKDFDTMIRAAKQTAKYHELLEKKVMLNRNYHSRAAAERA